MLAALALSAVTFAVPTLQDPAQPVCNPGTYQPLAFPLQTLLTHPTLRAHCYLPDAADRARVRALRGYRCVRLSGLRLPGGGTVSVELTRIDDVAPATISVDGLPPGHPNNPAPSPMMSWNGHVANVAGSRACITFSDVGVWGWVRTNTSLFQIASFPDGGDWTQFRTLIVDDVDKNKLGNSRCGDRIDEPLELPLDYSGCIYGLGPSRWREECADTRIDQLRLCTMAVETDWQFYRRFGDVAAAEVYARFVIGAVAQQLRIDARTVIRMNYLGIHTTPQDPWRQQDIRSGQTSSPCCIDVIYEFQHEWGTDDWASRGSRFNLGPGRGNAPVPADIYHMMSGAEMGCGVAGGRIGNQEEAFSLSSGMGALNFDGQNRVDSRGAILFEPLLSPFFQIYGAGHEIGHNFGAPHTHALRIDVNGTPQNPNDDVPIDDCARDPGGGPPDCSRMGFARGTLMSYCIGCRPGFLRNIRCDYHDEIAKCMRGYAVNLPPFEDVHFVTDLGFASAPAGRTPPSMSFTGYAPGMDRVKLSTTNIPTHGWHVLIFSANGRYTPFRGSMIVPGPDAWWTGASAATPIDIPIPDGVPNGIVVYFQQFFAQGSDLYGTNAIALEIVR